MADGFRSVSAPESSAVVVIGKDVAQRFLPLHSSFWPFKRDYRPWCS